ncbi:PREDICTED: uncharacterized protein LOC109187208 [Ipomoea nil]|uniref:uncharacterized protein LOC109187208 n=1 Tax=Ipomoea nil TaxID=35883 RepID=UPI000901BF6D|nr:PREDICTED: uncharacterized protein LOC109187208 [Ipomoea nil]
MATTTTTHSWTKFTHDLLEEFGDELPGPPFEQLAALRQTGLVDEFIAAFRARIAQIPGLAPHIQLGLFLNGLKPAIRVRLRPNDVTDLRTAMRVARAAEREIEFLSTGRLLGRSLQDENAALQIIHSHSGSTWSNGHGKNSQTNSVLNYSQPKPIPTQSQFSGSNQTSSFSSQTQPAFPAMQSSVRNSSTSTSRAPARHYSNKEYLDMRAKGLCFRCQQPYSPLHVCPNKSLQTLIAAEDDEDETSDEPGVTDQIDTGQYRAVFPI